MARLLIEHDTENIIIKLTFNLFVVRAVWQFNGDNEEEEEAKYGEEWTKSKTMQSRNSWLSFFLVRFSIFTESSC